MQVDGRGRPAGYQSSGNRSSPLFQTLSNRLRERGRTLSQATVPPQIPCRAGRGPGLWEPQGTGSGVLGSFLSLVLRYWVLLLYLTKAPGK